MVRPIGADSPYNSLKPNCQLCIRKLLMLKLSDVINAKRRNINRRRLVGGEGDGDTFETISIGPNGTTIELSCSIDINLAITIY